MENAANRKEGKAMKLFSNMPNMRKIPLNPLMFIWEALYGARKWALTALALAFGLQLMKIYVPVFFSRMIEYFSKITPQELVWHKVCLFLALIFAAYLGQSVFRMIREVIEENNVRNFIDAKIKLFAVDYLAKHSENYFSAQKAGQLSQKVLQCADKSLRLHSLISRLYSNIFAVLINFYFIGCVSPWFLLIVIVFGSVSSAASYLASIKLRTLNKDVDNMFDDFNGILADSISNSLNIKACGSEEYEVSFVLKAFDQCKKARLKAINKFQNSLRFQRIMLCLFESCTMLLMIKLWYMQKINVGDVTLILMLMNKVILCFTAILGNICDLNSTIGSLSAAMSPFTAEHEIVDKPNAKALKISGGAIEFKNVKFSYEGKKVFQNLSFKIRAGEKIGIVGASGSGKSTLINLLQRAYDIKSGEILIDGQSIAKVKQSSLHEAMALIPQDTSLFHRSISQNIAYGKLRSKQAQIEDAAKKAYADEFIRDLPKGYQTKVGEKGVKLSGGERQRVAIARAVLKNSPILILDEATSALDSKSESYIQKAMQKLMKNKTVLAVAHRLSTLKEMDRIIVLDKGKIAEQGNMEELLALGGIFKRLWEMQNKN